MADARVIVLVILAVAAVVLFVLAALFAVLLPKTELHELDAAEHARPSGHVTVVRSNKAWDYPPSGP